MTTSNNFWDSKQYSQFLKARTKPAKDLLSSIPDIQEPTLVYDLGCGPGNSTILLKQRWPNAIIVGVDSSEDMLKTARSTYPEIDFKLGDIANFSFQEKCDVIFANASLQWIDDHQNLINQLVSQLNNNGILAIQMPNNFHCPSHQITIDLLNNNPDWQSLKNNLRYDKLTSPYYKMDIYYRYFTDAGLTNVLLWETDYYQEMENHHAIYEWASGTGLRPVISKLDEKNKALFIEKYVSSLKTVYPTQANGKVLFPFKRIFMIGCLAN